jgi:hypothetical protein
MPGGYSPAEKARALALAAHRELMVCPDPHCAVEWQGRDLPCWVCGRAGSPKYPVKKKES